jgi:hypothetical protein
VVCVPSLEGLFDVSVAIELPFAGICARCTVCSESLIYVEIYEPNLQIVKHMLYNVLSILIFGPQDCVAKVIHRAFS